MKHHTTIQEKVKQLNEAWGTHYQFDEKNHIFHPVSGVLGGRNYYTERDLNRMFNRTFVRGYRAKNRFKRETNRINRREEKRLVNDPVRVENVSGVVHRGDIWDIT
jgi:hypothetical protein